MSIPNYPTYVDAFEPENPGSLVDEVLAGLRTEDPWDYDYDQVRAVQLKAFNERLSEQAAAIPMVGRRVADLGIESIETAEDILPLLFSPTVYKSYPESFVTQGKWSNLLRWLDGLSSERLTGIDMEGVQDMDDFIDRCLAAGTRVVTTSGTSGKFSLMPESTLDVQRTCEVWTRSFGAMWGLDGTPGHPLFYAGNRTGAHRGQVFVEAMRDVYSDEENFHALFPFRLLASEVGRMAALNSALANGTASPSDIAEGRRLAQEAKERAESAFDVFIDALASYNGTPVYMWGQLFGFYALMKRAQERGVKLDFSPEGAVIMAGGLKNNRVPGDYMKELRDFYGMKIRSGYAQSEILAFYLECDHGRYHMPSSVLTLLVDGSGEHIVEPVDGVGEGVLAAFDFVPRGRWGGVISSDWVTIDYRGCPCGRRSPAVVSVSRYNGPDQGEKLDCQGRVEMYIRGVVDEPSSL